MPSTTYKGYSVPTTGTETNTWGDDINANSFGVIDKNLGGIVTKTLTSSNVTLSSTEAQSAILRLTGTISANIQITSGVQGFTIVENLTSGAFTVTFYTGVGSAVTLVQGTRTFIISDATNGARAVASNSIDALGTAGVIRRSSGGVISTDSGTTNILFARDNSGIVLSSGIQGDIPIPFACTITGVLLFANTTGSMVVDLWKDSYANFPPTNTDSICASAKPTLSSALKYSDTTLTGWTTSVSAGDVIRVNLDSVSTISRYTLALTVTRY